MRPKAPTRDAETLKRLRELLIEAAKSWGGASPAIRPPVTVTCLDLHERGEATKGNHENLAARTGLTTLHPMTPI